MNDRQGENAALYAPTARVPLYRCAFIPDECRNACTGV